MGTPLPHPLVSELLKGFDGIIAGDLWKRRQGFRILLNCQLANDLVSGGEFLSEFAHALQSKFEGFTDIFKSFLFSFALPVDTGDGRYGSHVSAIFGVGVYGYRKSSRRFRTFFHTAHCNSLPIAEAPFRFLSSAEGFVYCAPGLAVHAGNNVGICVEGEGYRGMAEEFLDVLRMDVSAQEERGAGVAEVVEAAVSGESGAFCGDLELAVEVAVVLRCPDR